MNATINAGNASLVICVSPMAAQQIATNAPVKDVTISANAFVRHRKVDIMKAGPTPPAMADTPNNTISNTLDVARRTATASVPPANTNNPIARNKRRRTGLAACAFVTSSEIALPPTMTEPSTVDRINPATPASAKPKRTGECWVK